MNFYSSEFTGSFFGALMKNVDSFDQVESLMCDQCVSSWLPDYSHSSYQYNAYSIE